MQKTFSCKYFETAGNGLKNHDIISDKIPTDKGKIRVKSMFATNRKSIGYKVMQEKMLNWTSKGRQLDLKRASIASQLGVFS